MSIRSHDPPKIAIVINERTDSYIHESTAASNKEELFSQAATKGTKSTATTHVKIDEEMETMLSLAQTMSFDYSDDGHTYAERTFATSFDDDSYDDDGNSLESMSTYGERRDRQSSSRNIKKNQLKKRVVACGEGIEDASDIFLESLIDTGRAISSAIKVSQRFGKLFVSKQEKEEAREEKKKRLEEERRMKRDETTRGLENRA